MLKVIYSKEETTLFLESFVNFLHIKFIDFVEIYVINEDNKKGDCLNFISESNIEDLIIFLGHGSSNKLYYSEEKKVLIDKENANLLVDKNLFCFSCDSNKLIKKLNLKSGIGFGDIPTDWKHIINLRDLEDVNAYSGITIEIISQYNKVLIELLIESFDKCKNSSFAIIDLFHLYNLLLNKKINNFIIEKNKSELIKLMFQLKFEINIIR
jgi:hypothetical protein